MPKAEKYQAVIRDVLSAAQAKDFAGYSKFDALNSPLLERLTFNSKWLRFAYTQAVKQCPWHIRPLLGVRISRNPKGIALFARAYLFLYQATGDETALGQADALLAWLLEHPSSGKNLCWGYNFIWQNTLFLQDRYEPNVVVSVFVGEAMLHAYRVTRKPEYLQHARSVCAFICEDVPVVHDTPEERAIAYVLREVKAAVLNNNILAGALLIKVWKETEEAALRDIATCLMTYTVKRRTKYDAWYYTFPSNKSHIRHDNYHTGGIVDGLIEYFEETGDDRFNDVYWKGLEYYHTHLFEADGAPRWMNDSRYPYDIHGSAQGIISFAKAARHRPECREMAERIADWTLAHLYRPATHDFLYRQGRFLRWNYSLMRWCNAWMTRALGELTC